MNGKGMQTMRTSEEMFRLILDVAREDDRIRAVVLSGRAPIRRCRGIDIRITIFCFWYGRSPRFTTTRLG